MAFRLLFVCTGNTCRSPLAEVIARKMFAENGLGSIEASSAGTNAVDGQPASEGARTSARERGLDLETFRSRALTRERIESADLILVMEPQHRARVLSLSPSADTRTHLLGAFSGEEDSESGIPDPFGGTAEVYRSTLERIEKHVRAGLARVRELAQRRSDSSS
jgi:protein-tyrosine-phosphatase